MRRLFSTSFIALALVVSAAGIAPAAHAQTGKADGGSCFENSDCASNYCSPTENLCLKNAAAKSGNTYAPDTSSANTSVDPNLGKDTKSQLNGIMGYIVQLFAWLLGVAVLTLDNAVFYTVVTMGDYVNKLSAVGVTWRILRDIGNIIIIFGFLAIGITTILNVDWYGGGKKMLPMLLVSAVFLNFSLFLSEAVIDTGNLFATQIYTQINGNTAAGAKSFGLSSINNEGISNKIMSSLGLQTIYGEAQNPAKAKALFDNYWTIGFMSIFLFIVAAFVFFSLAFILIARFVILLFLIIISPIGFAGLAVPQLKNMANKWWGTLFEQAITAPVLLLLLYIALAVITDVQFLTGFSDCVADAASTAANSCSNPSYVGYVNGNFNGFASVILSFLVAMGLLLAVVIVSKKLSAFGGGGATKLAGKLTFGATAMGMNAALGGTAFALRRGIVQRFNPTSRFGRGAQRLASRGLRATEGVRMDIRAVPGVGSVLGEAGAPIQQSAISRAKQGAEWVRHGGDAANTQMAQETRIPRLIAAVNRGDRGESLRLMRTVTDDELHRRDIENLITTNPMAVQILTNHQVALLPDNILTNANVYQNLSAIQLEAYRAAGNGAPRNAAMEGHLRANQYDPAYLALRNPGDARAITTFWNL